MNNITQKTAKVKLRRVMGDHKKGIRKRYKLQGNNNREKVLIRLIRF